MFKKNKITRYQGVGEITGQGKVTVHGEDGDTELAADNIIIATGSKVASLPGVELDGDRVGTSTEALDYGEVPQHLSGHRRGLYRFGTRLGLEAA